MNIIAEAGPLYVRIGVTGHRYLRDEKKLRGGLVKAMHRIQKATPGCLLAVLSPLAEGADRLAAEVVLQYPGAKMIVPLPLPPSEYIQDFTSADSKKEFLRMLDLAEEVILLPPAPTREAAYKAAGDYILQHCHILVAFWDGEASRGHGGTGEVAASALDSGKPVCHIWAGNNAPHEKERTDVGEKHGRVRWLNFPAKGAASTDKVFD